MEILPVDLNEMGHCNFAGLEVDFLQLNREEIWKVSNGKLILNVSSYYYDETGLYYLACKVNAIEDTIVTFNNYNTTILAGETQELEIISGAETQETGDLIIDGKCEFASLAPTEAGNVGMVVNEIKEWISGIDYIPTGFFLYADLTPLSDIHIPNNIREIQQRSLDWQDLVSINVYLPKSLKVYGYPSLHYPNYSPLNAEIDGIMAYLEDCCLGTNDSTTTITENVVLRNGTRVLPSNNSDTTYPPFRNIQNIQLNEDGALTEIPEKCFYSSTNLVSLIIPSSVTKIGNNAFDSCNSLEKLVVKTPNDIVMELGTSLFGTNSKTAKAVMIFTDNDSIKNYDYSTDNVTPTFYALYQADWETLSTPTISLSDTTLTITPVENATQYVIYSGTTELFRTTETTIDLAQYQTSSAQYICVQALAEDGYLPSKKSISLTLVAVGV